MDIDRLVAKFREDSSNLSLVDAFLLLKHFAEEKKGLIEGLSVQATHLEHYNPAHYKSTKDAILERIGYQIKLSRLIPQKDMSKELSGFDVEEMVVFLSRVLDMLSNRDLRERYQITNKKDFKNIMDILVNLKHNPRYIEDGIIPQIYINLFKKKFPGFLENEYRPYMAKIRGLSEEALSINRLQKREIIDMDDPSRVLALAREAGIEDINKIKSIYRNEIRKVSDICSRLMIGSLTEDRLFEKIEDLEVMKIGFMNSLIREAEEISKKELRSLV